jgi:hypothetical protein
MTGVSHAGLMVARSRLAIHRQLATTPGRLRLAAALLVVGAVGFGAVAGHAADTRRQALQAFIGTEPRLVSAVDLSASLSDAHATAAYSLLGGTESLESRRGYLGKLRQAGAHLVDLAAATGGSPASAPALRSLTQRLPIYAGLIDTARANHRQGRALGSAYLRKAGATMRDELLPKARELYAIEASHLATHYGAGVSAWTARAVVLPGCAMVALLAAIQCYVARATRRIVNPGLALASAVMLGLMAWVLVAFAIQKRETALARSTGSEPVRLLTDTRSRAARAQADESVVLSNRPASSQTQPSTVDSRFLALTSPIGTSRPGPASGTGGLLAQAAGTDHSAGAVDRIYGAYRRYRVAHSRVVAQEIGGHFDAARRLAIGSNGAGGVSTTRTAAALNTVLDRQVEIAQDRFRQHTPTAQAALGGLATGIPVLVALSAVLALLGIRERLQEYR